MQLNHFVVLNEDDDDDDYYYYYLMDKNQIYLKYLNFFLMHVYEDFVDVKQVKMLLYKILLQYQLK